MTTTGKAKLFPVRQRCKTCGKGLGLRAQDPVYLGLYCTPQCAGMAAPASQPEDVPRGCRTQREGAWAFKRRYRSEQEIPARLREDASTSWYWCEESCGAIHLGHTRMGEREKFRMFEDLAADLPDLLIKLRGQATRKQVAEVAGVRPIRLKELEEGLKHPEGLETSAGYCGCTASGSAWRCRLGSSARQTKAPRSLFSGSPPFSTSGDCPKSAPVPGFLYTPVAPPKDLLE
ncbi:hypothetical protein [Kitasatospora sp. NPDC092286]|uniref:hypothetical protein n=1 Tax=Kitasatospora sp. NPDC092286 TaxID=3364087 RepID=UPI0038243F97